MLNYLWEKDGKYYGLDGSKYDSEPTIEEVASLQEYARQFTNNRAGYENAFNQNVASVLGVPASDNFEDDSSCHPLLCPVKVEYHDDGHEPRVEAITQSGGDCYQLTLIFWNLVPKTPTVNIGHSIKYAYDNSINDKNCLPYLIPGGSMYDCQDDRTWIGICFSAKPEDISNPDKYVWLKLGSGGDPSSQDTKTVYAFKRTPTIYTGSSSSDYDKPTGGNYENPSPDPECGWSLSVTGNTLYPVWMSIGVFQPNNDHVWQKPVKMSDSKTFQTEWADSSADAFYQEYLEYKRTGGLSGRNLLSLNDFLDPSNEYEGINEGLWELSAVTHGYGSWSDEANNAKYMAMSNCVSGVWEDWSVVKIAGSDGVSGKSATQTGMAFARVKKNYERQIEGGTTNVPLTPVSGRYNPSTGEISVVTAPEDAAKGISWSTENESRADDEYTWLSTANFDVENGNIIGSWSEPVRITGDDGVDGTDSTGREFIYRCFNTEEDFEAYDPSTDTATSCSLGCCYYDCEDYQNPGFVPDNWTDHPVGITHSKRVEACCVRVMIDDEWQPFSEPFIWSSWGVDGIDGDGVEYIYCITTDPGKVHYDEFTGDTGNTAITWTEATELPLDEDVDENSPYYLHVTEGVDEGYYEKWYEFPYGSLLPPSEAVGNPEGTIEQQIQYAYYQLSDFVPGDKVKADIENHDSELWKIARKIDSAVTTSQLETYVGSLDKNWTDNPLDVGPQQPYEWVSTRKYKRWDESQNIKEWGGYTEPSRWNNWAKDGKDGKNGTSVYTSFVFCRTYDDLRGLDLCGGVFEYPMPGITYGEEPGTFVSACTSSNAYIEFREVTTDQGRTYQSVVTYNNKQYIFEDTVPQPTGDLNETIWMSMRIFGDDETGESQGWTSPQSMADSTDFNVEFCSADLKDNEIAAAMSSSWNFGIYTSMFEGRDDDKHSLAEAEWRNEFCNHFNLPVGSWSDDGTNAIYMATTTFRNGKWTNWSISKIKGEKGEAGTAMKIKGSSVGVVMGSSELQDLTGLAVGDCYAVICSNKPGCYEICRFDGVDGSTKIFKSLGFDEGEDIEEQTGYVIDGIVDLSGGNQQHTGAEIAAGCSGCPGVLNGDLLVWSGDKYTGWIKVANLAGDSSYIHIKYADWMSPTKDWYRLTKHTGYSDGEYPGKYMGMYADNMVADNTGTTYGSETSPGSSGNYIWCKNGEPYVWTFWGGEDGFGYEYIYILTQDNTAPNIPTAPYTKNGSTYTVDSIEYQTNDFVPDNWTDEAIQCNSINRFRWKCFRQKENGRWKAFEGNNGKAIFDANCANDLLVADFNNDLLPVYVKEKRVQINTEYTVTASLSEGDRKYIITNLTPPSVTGVIISGITGYNTTGVTCNVKITTDLVFAGNESSVLLDFEITGHEEGTSVNKTAHCSLTILPVGTGVIYQLVPAESEIKWDDDNNRAQTQYLDCGVLKTILGESSGTIPSNLFPSHSNDFKVYYSLYNNDTAVSGMVKRTFPTTGDGIDLWSSEITTKTYNIIVVEVYGLDSGGNEILNDKETIHALRDGHDGSSPYLADFYNDFDSIPLNDQGNVTPLDGSSSDITIPSRVSLFKGASEVTISNIAYRINGETTYTQMTNTDTWYAVVSRENTPYISVKQNVDGSGRTITVKVKNGIPWAGASYVDNNTNQFKLDILVKENVTGAEYSVATMTIFGIMPGAEGKPVTIMNLFPDITSIVKKDDNGTWVREPSMVKCNLIERQGTDSTTYESGTNDFNNIITPTSGGGRGYRIRYYFDNHPGTTYDYTTSIASSGVSTSTLDEFLTFLLYDKDGTMVDKEDIPVVSDGQPGGLGPQGRGVVARCEYYVYADTPDGSKLTPNPSQNTGFIINDYGVTTSCMINNKTCQVTMIGTYMVDSNTVSATTTTTIPASTSDAPYLWKRTVNWYNSAPMVEQGPVEFVTSKQITNSAIYYSRAISSDAATTVSLQAIWQRAKNNESNSTSAVAILTGTGGFTETSAQDPDAGKTVWSVTVIFYTDGSCFIGPMSVCKTTVNVEDIDALLNCFGAANVTFDRGAYLKEFLGVIDTSADPENLKKADVKAFLNATNYWSSSTNNRLMFAAGVKNLGFNGGETIPSGQTPNMQYFDATTKIWENGRLECAEADIEGTIKANAGKFGSDNAYFLIGSDSDGDCIKGMSKSGSTDTEFFKLNQNGINMTGAFLCSGYSESQSTSPAGYLVNNSATTILSSISGYTYEKDYDRDSYQGSGSGKTLINLSEEILFHTTGKTYHLDTINTAFIDTIKLNTSGISFDEQYSATSNTYETTGLFDTAHTVADISMVGINFSKNSRYNSYSSYTISGQDATALTYTDKYSITNFHEDYISFDSSEEYYVDDTKKSGDTMSFLVNNSGLKYTSSVLSSNSRANVDYSIVMSNGSITSEFTGNTATATTTMSAFGLTLNGTYRNTSQQSQLLTKKAVYGPDSIKVGLDTYYFYASPSLIALANSSPISTPGEGVRIQRSLIRITGKMEATEGFYQSSDARLKNLGEPLSDVLSKIDKIDTVYYTLKDDKENKRHIGTTAQSLLEDYPEFVRVTDGDDKYTVDYAKLSVLALAAIKELKVEIDDLKEEIKQLKENK